MTVNSQPAPQELKELRAAIDAVDAQLLDLLSRRGRLVVEVGHLKQRENSPILRPEREAQVLQRLVALNQGPLSSEAVQAIFREIISASRALEKRLVVAYLGPEGTYTEQAMRNHFGQMVDGASQASITEVFRAVEVGRADFGVVPIENSTEGSVNQTLDALLQTPLTICGELALPIHHHLLNKQGTMDNVTKIYGHPQALAQCQAWLTQHYPNVQRVSVASNAEGAKLAMLQADAAAIAGDSAAQQYGLQIVAAHIQDDAHNRTRFIVIGRIQPAASGKDHTTLILSVPNRAGAVYDMLQPLARHGVSMTRFESRPARTGKWEYYFYIDLEGHQSDAGLTAALAELQTQTAFCKILGSYPVKTISS